jgi:MFS family permease
MPVFALLAANAVSQVGNVLSLVAIPWYVLQTTESATKTGLTGFFTVLPIIFAGLFGGALVDQIGHRRTSIIADIASGVTVALIPLLASTVGLSFWQILILVFVGALLDVPGVTARQSLLPDLAKAANIQLERVNAAYQTIQHGASLVGPLLAGVLIAMLGTTNLLWLNAVTFGISAMTVAILVPRSCRSEPKSSLQVAKYVTDLIEGWQFIWRQRILFSLTLANAVGNFISAPLYAVIVPVYASQVLGSSVHLGLMLAGAGVGALIGAILYGMFGHVASRRWVYTGSWLLGSVPFWVLAGTPPMVIVIGMLFLMGLSDGPINPLMYTLSQEHTPTALRGRVFGARIAVANIAAPAGLLPVGVLIDTAGVVVALIVLGSIQAVFAIYILVSRTFRSLDIARKELPS